MDFQGFKTIRNEIIVKELAIVSTDDSVYELHLFQPPCSFNELSVNERKQVVWLERHHHGLYWNSGFRQYNELKDVFDNLNIEGKFYVKGAEKKRFAEGLLSAYNVEVVNVEDIGCPNFKILKHQYAPAFFKPCHFGHGIKNCAFINVQTILEWLKDKENVVKSK